MKTIDKYRKMIAYIRSSESITEQEITSSCSALRNGSDEVKCLLEESLLYDGYFSCPITKRQSDKGLAWIKANRRTKILKCFTESDWKVFDDFDCFLFMGFYSTDGFPGIYPRFDRVYRVYGKGHAWFDYTCVAGSIKVIARSAES